MCVLGLCVCGAVGFLLCLDKADYPNATVLAKNTLLSYQYEIKDALYYKTAKMLELDEASGGDVCSDT